MSLIRFFSCLAFLFSTLASAGTNGYEVPDQFNSVSTDSSDAYTFAKQCQPSTTEYSFKKIIKDAGSNSSIIIRNSNAKAPFLVVNSIRTICVAMSDKLYFTLPCR